MYQYTALQWLLFFYIYCFIGWCWETFYVSVRQKKFVNRGFMNGPFLPIYGTGAIMMLVVSAPFQDNLVLTYFAGVAGATVLELVTGVLMEMLFKVRYWDYSNQPFNYKGYICLSSSVAWGFFTILLTRIIHKPIERFVLGLPGQLSDWVSIVLTCYIVADFAVSFKGALNLRTLLSRMEKTKEELATMERRLDAMIGFSTDKWRSETEQYKRKFRELVSGANSSLMARKKEHRWRIFNNPTMVSKRYQNSLNELKQALEEARNKRK